MEALTFTEMKERFKDEWGLVMDPEKDETGEVVKGEILYHSQDKQKVYEELPKYRLQVGIRNR